MATKQRYFVVCYTIRQGEYEYRDCYPTTADRQLTVRDVLKGWSYDPTDADDFTQLAEEYEKCGSAEIDWGARMIQDITISEVRQREYDVLSRFT
jgi:hypothetical protein